MRWCCLTFALVVSSGGLQAQVPDRVVPDSGMPVRFIQPPSKLWRSGVMLGREGSTIRVRLDGAGYDEVVSLDSIQQLQGGTPRSRGDGAQRGALIGLLVGVAATTVLLVVVDTDCPDGCAFPPRLAAAIVGSVGTVGLTLGGALLGAGAPGVIWSDEARRSSYRGSRQLQLGLRVALPGLP